MSFLDLFIKRNKPVEDVEKRDEEVNVSASLFGGSLQYNNQSSYHSTRAMQHSTVFRCTDLISSTIAQLPIVVSKTNKDGYKEIIRDHVVFTILNKKPNKRQDKNTFFKALIMNLLLSGNAYALIKRDSNKQITELQYVPSDMVSIVSNSVFDEPYYLVTGIKQKFSPSEILHFKNIVDREGIRGISTISFAKKCLTLAFDENDSADGFFRSGGAKCGIIKADKPINDAQEQEIMGRWQRTFNASNGAPNGVVLMKSGLSFEPISTNPQDAELLDSRRFSVLEICRFFSVPPSMAFDNSNNSYKSVEAENLAFITKSIIPMCDKLESELNAKLWNVFEEDYQVKFDTSILLRGDKEALSNYYQKLSGIGVLSVNEVRRDLDLSPIEGGDIHTVQVNLVDINKLEDMNYKAVDETPNNVKGEDNTNTEEKEVEDDKNS